MILRRLEKRGRGRQGGSVGRSGPSFFLALPFFLVLFLLPSSAAAIQFTGLVELETGFTDTTSKTGSLESKSQYNQFLQRYQIGVSGVILDPRFVSYTGTIGVQDSTFKTESFTGQSTRISRDTLTYSLQMSFFPTRWPLIFYAQRNIISADAAGDTTADTLSLNGVVSLRRFPTLRFTLLQLGSEFDDPSNPRETRIRIANIGLSQQFKASSLSFNYQVTDYLVRTGLDETSSAVSNFSFRGETTLRPGLYTHAHATYFPEGSVFAPGLTSASETTGGVGFLQQAGFFTQGGNYEFFDTAGTDVKRNIASYNFNYRPLAKTDYRGDVSYIGTDSPQSAVTDYRVSGGIGHRPFFGLSLTGNLLVNHTDTSIQTTGSSTAADRIGAGVGVSYFKPLDLVNLNSGYTTDYSKVWSDPSSDDGGIWTHTLSLGLSTRTLRTTQINGTYSFLWRENDITPLDDRKEHAVHLGLQDTTLRRLVLRASADFQNTDSFGFQGNTFLFDTRADYFPFPTVETSAGYRLSDFSKFSGTQDVSTYFLEGRHARYLLRNLYLKLSAHWDRDTYSYTEKDLYRLSALLQYQLGKITLSLDYRNELTKYPQTEYTVESVFIRASRPF